MEIQELLGRLRNVQPRGTNKWLASCPCGSAHAHNDKSRSLSVALADDGKILVHCHTGCSFTAICAALGCKKSDLMPTESEDEKLKKSIAWLAKNERLTPVAVYSYDYGEYNDGLRKVRFVDADGKKTFRWIRRDAQTQSGYKWNHEGCPQRLFVAGSLGADAVWVVEGEKDALTLHRLTDETAVSAENGATKAGAEGKWFIDYSRQLEGKTVCILGDNDEAGRHFAGITAAKLAGYAKRIFIADILTVWPECPGKGDITDMCELCGDEAAKKAVDLLMENAEEYIPAAPATEGEEEQAPAQEGAQSAQEAQEKPIKQPRSGIEKFDDFLKKIVTTAYQPIPTGMTAFDRMMGGGMPRQALIILQAAPGTGKTAICQQLTEIMAENGREVVYINMEMSAEQLMSRSLSRLVYSEGHRMSSAEILHGYAWNDEQREWMRTAANAYRREIAPNLTYNPDGVTSTLDSIIGGLTRAGEAAKAAGKPAPVAVVDYIHLITSERRAEPSEIIKEAVFALKRYAIAYDTFVLAISASNRSANKGGALALDAGRDSSALEYTADLALSLNYEDVHTGEVSPTDPDAMDRIQNETPRRMLMQVLKNRMGAAGSKLYLHFYPAFSLFRAYDQKSGMEIVDEHDVL